VDALQLQSKGTHASRDQLGHQARAVSLVETIQSPAEAIIVELPRLQLAIAYGAPIKGIHPSRQLVERFFAYRQVVAEQHQGVDYRVAIIAMVRYITHISRPSSNDL
jgi:hypothetical protein